MIRKLKIKFVLLSMTALLALLTMIVICMNLINYNSIIQEADAILSILSQNKGAFPDFGENKSGQLPNNMSPETPYESRFFSVFVDKSGNILNTETSQIVAVDGNAAKEYAQKVLKKSNTQGFIDEYRYFNSAETNGYRIIFLDCGRKLDSFYSFLYVSIGMAAAGLIIVFVIVFILSGNIIKPIAESYEKQRQFIADAGHEIKTPLTIINANVDLLEMELGKENESLSDIQQQTKRLRSLTEDLISLARIEKAEDHMQKIEFPISEVVEETILPFRTLAQQQGKHFSCYIQPMLTLKGNDKAIQQLVSIFMDNALKYSPPGGTIELNLMKNAHTIYLSVFNITEMEIKQDQLCHVFDRFYRTDASRNSETGGHGIGLSIAKTIVNAHGGKIQAWTPDGHSFQISAAFHE